MADFRQLALEFVLADDEAKLTALAQQAAAELQGGPANTNPVARWVEAVQPWMPGDNGDDVMTDGEETPDWTGRAKALEFLSRTLDFLNRDVLKPSQVKLLVSFFGAMFDIDHKAGILPSATALSRIVSMKAFQPASADDIIQKVCALKEDFPRQISKTRLAVFELVRYLITKPEVSSDLQYKHGASSGFMSDLLQLCRNERDPNCLMVWFDILAFFLQEYSPSQEGIGEVFGTFKAYFPITLPRTSQSGITPEELKLQLRKCFTSNHALAPLTFPFLLGKLDQGDGVTVNVKVDVLKTIKACLEEYRNPDESVTPYVDQIWGSLKYEVRNGEIEDTIWATLEVLKTVATKLKGDSLRDYALTVTRDCVNDLSNTLYTAAAGRLLVSVLSATPSAFVLMVSPTITHVKENLRHPKAPIHSQDLLKLLHVVLETRILLVDAEMTSQERTDFAAIDSIFKTLYEDVYKKPVELGAKADASDDDMKLSTQAVQGAGALVCQRPAPSITLSEDMKGSSEPHLLPGGQCLDICEILFTIITQSAITGAQAQTSASDGMVNEATRALQRAVTTYTAGYAFLVDKAVGLIRTGWKDQGPESITAIQTLGPLLAFVGCSELPRSPADGLNNFLSIIHALYAELLSAIDSKAVVKVWCALTAGLQAAVRYFNDACVQHGFELKETTWDSQWSSTIAFKYPILQSMNRRPAGDSASKDQMPTSIPDVHDDFLLISLYLVRQLYRKATKTVESPKGKKSLELSDDFTASDKSSESQYLHLVGTLGGFVFHEMSEARQLSLQAQNYALHLFRDDFFAIPESTSSALTADEGSGFDWDWVATERLNVLSFGILEALRPSAVAQLFGLGIAQELLISGVSVAHSYTDATTASVARSMLTILANKHKPETAESVMKALNRQSGSILEQPESLSGDKTSELEKAASMFAIAAGMLRRYSGKQAQGLLRLLRECPSSPAIGQHLSRRLEMVVAPQRILTKESFAVVKPLWMQKIYVELAKPMIARALGQNPESKDPVIKTNFSIGVLLMVKHMSFSIYEEDAENILRVAISVAQNVGTGPDARAALDVLKIILIGDSDKGEPHLGSIVTICINAFSGKPHSPPDWLPQGYTLAAASDTESQAASGKSALEIMGGLPRMFESRHLLPLAPRVERELTLACGNAVRELRKSARLARAAWREMR